MATGKKAKAWLVLTTVGSAREASRLARLLVQARLAACVNSVGPIRSTFRWKGRLEKEREWLLLVKTSARSGPRLARFIKTIHRYELPEVIAFETTAGLAQYLDWVAAETAVRRSGARLQPRKSRVAGKASPH